MGLKESDTTERLSLSLFHSCQYMALTYLPCQRLLFLQYGPAVAVSLPVPVCFIPGPNNSITLSAEKFFSFLQNEILIKTTTTFGSTTWHARS